MKVTLNAENQIIVDCNGGPKKELDIVYVNTKQGPKTTERICDLIRVSVDSDGVWTPNFPIRISIMDQCCRGLPFGRFNQSGEIPGEVLSIPRAEFLIKILRDAIRTAEANNELRQN